MMMMMMMMQILLYFYSPSLLPHPLPPPPVAPCCHICPYLCNVRLDLLYLSLCNSNNNALGECHALWFQHRHKYFF